MKKAIGWITVIGLLSTGFIVVLMLMFASILNHAQETRISSSTERSIVDYVNDVRKEHGKAPLKEDQGLDATAKTKGDDMALRNYWAHTTPDGQEFQVLLLKDRPGLKLYGENLAECYQTNKATVDAWVASPGHLANMLNDRFNIIGTYTVWDVDQSCAITVNHFGEE